MSKELRRRRDLFAAAVLSGIRIDDFSNESIVARAWAIADLMIKQEPLKPLTKKETPCPKPPSK